MSVHACDSVGMCGWSAKLSFLILFFPSFLLQYETSQSKTLVEAAHSEILIAFSKSKTEQCHKERTKEIKTLAMPQLSYAAVRNLIILSHRIMCPSEIILD